MAAAGKCKKAVSGGQAMLKQLGKQRVNNLFTHLRKIAQHPLLVRNLFTDAKVQHLVRIAHHRQVSLQIPAHTGASPVAMLFAMLLTHCCTPWLASGM